MDKSTRRCAGCGLDKPAEAWSPSRFKRGGRCRLCHLERERERNGWKPRPVYDVPDGHRRCSDCGLFKLKAEFPPSVRNRNVGGYCRSCSSARHRERYGPVRIYDERTCEGCGESFRPRRHNSSGEPARYHSKKCQVKHWQASGRGREAHLRLVHGITHADYERLLAEQGGGCALCGIRPEELTTGRYRKHLHVDHDHETGAFRGLLCPDHNLLLGRFGDSVDMFRKVVAYLEAHASL